MRFKLHHHQSKVYASQKRIIVASAGIQSGKTTVGSLWLGKYLFKYTQELDNFLIVAPTYKILSQATLPAFTKLYRAYGEYKKVDAEFKLYNGGTIFLRTATDPESIEGITNVRAIWADEGGRLSKYFWENIEGRSALMRAPILVTTTPYALNWLYKMWIDWDKGLRDDVEFFQFRSKDNPYFPKEEYERQKTLLDPRRFAMKYDGVFGKIEGLVYQKINLCPSKQLPAGTRYYAGVDWGYNPDPFALVVRAVTPDNIHYRVAEFLCKMKTISEIIQIVKQRKELYNIQMCFCDPSQPAAIAEFNKAGIPAVGSRNEIRLGIDKQIELINTNRFFIFEDMNPIGIDEYNSYHYPEPEEMEIDENSKEQLPVDNMNHSVDADRYVTLMLEDLITERKSPKIIDGSSNRPTDQQKRIEWLKKGGSKRIRSIGEF